MAIKGELMSTFHLEDAVGPLNQANTLAVNFFNLHPDRDFFITRAGRGSRLPPGVSKLSVVALRNKNQSIALKEYS